MGLVSLQVQTQEVLVAVWWVNEILLVLELLLEGLQCLLLLLTLSCLP